jgi:hypothetical protein
MAVVSVVILVLVLFFGRYILAFLAIITGDKTVLHEAGNLCDPDDPLANSRWTKEEMRKPGDPEPPPPINYEWWGDTGKK